LGLGGHHDLLWLGDGEVMMIDFIPGIIALKMVLEFRFK
jgi:hypothetical protein